MYERFMFFVELNGYVFTFMGYFNFWSVVLSSTPFNGGYLGFLKKSSLTIYPSQIGASPTIIYMPCYVWFYGLCIIWILELAHMKHFISMQ